MTRSMTRTSALAVLLALCLGKATAQNTTRVSVDSAGQEANGPSDISAISGNGRYVAFSSHASNLVPGDVNGKADVFVHDRMTGAVTLVSVSTAGAAGNGDSGEWPLAISADGSTVTFSSFASNLVPGDGNGKRDVFVHDRLSGTTTRVSVDSTGLEGNAASWSNSIAADGRLVAFHSLASNLVPGDTNSSHDVFVHDRQTGTTTRVSVDSSGVEGNANSWYSAISLDASCVAYHSSATGLVPGDTNGVPDVFVHDLLSGTTTRVSVNSSGTEGDKWSNYPSLSGDGRIVGFTSEATNLVAGDSNGTRDVFVHDRQTGRTTLVSVSSSGVQGNLWNSWSSVSAAGDLVSFYSDSTNLVPGDTNRDRDVFLRDRVAATTTRVSVSSSGAQGNGSSYRPSLSADGRCVTFWSFASNLVPSDGNKVEDIFVHGPSLALDAIPGSVTTGDNITLTTWGGWTGGSVFLYAVDLNGARVLIKVTKGGFDATGQWILSAAVPSGLSGNVVTFQCIGLAWRGGVELTNRETVTFR